MPHNSPPHACQSRSDDALRQFIRAFVLAAIVASGVVVNQHPAALGLTAEERSELARKFKYYHRTVRPTLELNLLDTLNGTFFRLITELELQNTVQPPEGPVHRLNVDIALFVHYRDERLLLRDLASTMAIPDEFHPWMPRIQPLPMELAHGLSIQKSATFEPRTGHLTAIFRFYGTIQCEFEAWKMPFEQYKCYFWLETDSDEHLSLRTLRDLRPDWQMRRIKIGTEHWPFLTLSFNFKSHRWQHILVSAYLPSLLLFLCALLAQWRRRKVQVIVTMGALLAILILFHQQSQSVLASQSTASLLDLWLGGVICLLCLDLMLPARRVLVFKKASNGSTTRRAVYSSLPPTQNGRALSSSQPLYSTPHYVSSTHLHLPPRSHAIRPALRHNRHGTPSPGQLIRTLSVPPRRPAHVPARAAAIGAEMLAAQSEPLQRRMTAPPPPALPRTDSGEQRAQRIATLLAEMESIRRETAEDDGPSLRHADSIVAVDELLMHHSSEEVLIKSSPSRPPMEPSKLSAVGNGVGGTLAALNTCAMRRFPSPSGAVADRNSASDSELGRAEGIPRRKKVMLGFVALSFCFFFTSYVALVALVTLDLIDTTSNL